MARVPPLSASPPVARKPLNFCSKLKQLAEIILQLAIRVLFVGGTILLTAAVFPTACHAIVIPTVGFSATLLSAFFFPQENLAIPYFGLLDPLIRPIPPYAQGQMPSDMPLNAPRGLINTGNNCPFNSLIQFLEVDPLVAHWFRHPLTAEMDMAAFQQFLAGYHPPDQLVADFVTYAAAQRPPRPIPAMFREFLQNDQPPPEHLPQIRKLRETYEHLLILQRPYSELLAAYDQALRGNLAVVSADSQALRLALNQITPLIIPAGPVQIDASEAMRYILDILPDDYKMRIETTYYPNTNGRSPLAQPMVPKEERVGFLTLEFFDDDPAPTLEKLCDYYADHGNNGSYKALGTDGAVYEYPLDRCTVRFLEFPPTLRFHIKRFTPAIAKNDTPIQVPPELQVTLANGERKKYRLASSIHHAGTVHGGHYTSFKEDGRYWMDDSRISFVDSTTWDEHLRETYVLCYLPV